MPQEIDSPPVAPASAPAHGGSSRRRRRSGSSRGRKPRPVYFDSGNAQRGRILLVGIFCVERMFEIFLYFGIPSGGDRSQILASVITSSIWMAALTVGVWRRLNWCRYIMIFLEFLSGGAGLILLIQMLPLGFATQGRIVAAAILGISVVIHGAFGWVLIRSRDIRRLTSQVYQ